MYNKSKSLEFSNFRKFQHFPRIEFNDITFLVGANNSGKSTFVKAIMVVYNYLQNRNLSTIDFNANGVEELNIVSYDRALHKSNVIAPPDSVNVQLELHDYKFDVTFTKHKESTKAKVLSLKCTFFAGTEVLIDPIEKTITVSEQEQVVVAVLGTEKDDAVQKQISQLESQLSAIEDQFSSEYIETNSALEKIKKSAGIGEKSEDWKVSFDYQSEDLVEVLTGLSNLISTMPMLRSDNVKLDENVSQDENDMEDSFAEPLDFPVENQTYHYDSDRDNWTVRLAMDVENITAIQTLYNTKSTVIQFLSGIKNIVLNSEIAYLPATLNKQSPLFSLRDEKNPLAQTIHKYWQKAETDNQDVIDFIKSWLLKFDVGEDFRIEQIQDEAYTFEIRNNGIWTSLADKGMGSIQATLLILRLASLIRHQKVKNKNYTVILEEPELNLHPALQSKLSDLFFEVNNKYNIEFVIETHSEYMIRRSQVLTAQFDFNTIAGDLDLLPFSTLYFPASEEDAYSMNYNSDGSFERKFGEGFFDASFKTTAELFKIKKSKEQKI